MYRQFVNKFDPYSVFKSIKGKPYLKINLQRNLSESSICRYWKKHFKVEVMHFHNSKTKYNDEKYNTKSIKRVFTCFNRFVLFCLTHSEFQKIVMLEVLDELGNSSYSTKNMLLLF